MPRRHRKSSVAGGWINDAAAYLSERVIRRVGLLHSARWQAGPSCSSNGVKQEDGIWCPVRPQGCALVELRERPDGVSLTCLLPCFSASLQTSNDRHTVWLTVALSPRLLTGSKLKVVDGGRIVPVDPSPCPTKGSIYLAWQANDKLRPHAFRTTPHAQENMPASEPEPIPRPLISLQFYFTEQVQQANDVYIHDLQV